MRSTQQRCRVLEYELAECQKQLCKRAAAIPPSAGKRNGKLAGEPATDDNSALHAQLQQARQAQQEARAAAAAAAAERALLDEQVDLLGRHLAGAQQQLADAAAAAAMQKAAASPAAEADMPAAGGAAAQPPGSAVEQSSDLQQLNMRLEQVEFERAELAVMLEESRGHVAALHARLAELEASQQQPADSAAPKLKQTGLSRGVGTAGSGSDGSRDGGWLLTAAGHAGSSGASELQAELDEAQGMMERAKQHQEGLQQQVAQLRHQLQQVAAENSGLKAELAAASAQVRRRQVCRHVMTRSSHSG